MELLVAGSAPHRLAVVIVRAMDLNVVPRTYSDLGRVAHAASGTVRGWCRALDAPGRGLLRFTHGLGAVCHGVRENRSPLAYLEFADERTRRRYLRSSGLSASEFSVIRATAYCMRQRFLTQHRIVDEVMRLVPEVYR